jgi:cardiolipin synthase (CMP-forming)
VAAHHEAQEVQPPGTPDRVLTVPNALSAVRLALLPVFVWLVLGPEADAAAVGVLVAIGLSDYLDGYLARRLNQTSKLGALLDPIADRLYILAAVVALGIREIIPLWLVVGLPARDVFLWLLVPFLRTRGYSALPVHFLGKAATAALIYAFPLLLLGDGDSTVALVAQVFGWAFAIWGIGMYWWAGVLYALQVRRLLATTAPVPRRGRAAGARGAGGGVAGG